MAQYVLFKQSALNSLSSFLKNEDKEVLLEGASEQRENTELPLNVTKVRLFLLFSANKGGLTGEN